MVGFGLDNVEMGRKIAPLVVSLTDDIDHNLRVVVTQSFPREGDPDDYWEVSFAGYVLFMERDESYTVPDDYEVRRGRWLEDGRWSPIGLPLSKHAVNDFQFAVGNVACKDNVAVLCLEIAVVEVLDIVLCQCVDVGGGWVGGKGMMVTIVETHDLFVGNGCRKHLFNDGVNAVLFVIAWDND